MPLIDYHTCNVRALVDIATQAMHDNNYSLQVSEENSYSLQWLAMRFAEWSQSLKHTPSVFMERYKVKRAMLPGEKGTEMKKNLGPFELLLFGCGCIIGSGVFVTTGKVAALVAGPAVGFSYVIAGIGALLCALCYAEFAVELKLAGSAFSYVLFTGGEFLAWIAGCLLLLEYVLSSAAVARAFSSYFATLCQQEPSFFWIPVGGMELDPLALGLCLVLSVLLAWSQKGTALFNLVATGTNIVLILFIVILGLLNANVDNWSPFLPYGAKGMVDGSGLVFFSFIGFDAVATTAEEVKKPGRDLPFGIVGSVVVASIVYFLMCCAITLMQPYNMIDINSPFPMAFASLGLNWAATIVALGASIGILTTLLVNMMGQARIVSVIGREGLLPEVLGKIHPKTGTPLISTVTLGAICAVIAFFTAFDILADMVSIGTLLCFYIVAGSLIYYRHHDASVNSSWPIKGILAGLTALNIGFACAWQITGNFLSFLFLVPYVGIIIAIQFFSPVVRVPAQFGIPFSPWTPAFAMFFNTLIMSGLDPLSFARTAGFLVVCVLIYLLYGMHNGATLAANKPIATEEDKEGTEYSPEEERKSFILPVDPEVEQRVSSYRFVRGPAVGSLGSHHVNDDDDDEEPMKQVEIA